VILAYRNGGVKSFPLLKFSNIPERNTRILDDFLSTFRRLHLYSLGLARRTARRRFYAATFML